jgi:hypothetical protein
MLEVKAATAGWPPPGSRSDRNDPGRGAVQAVNVYRLPVVYSTSFSGISCLARSINF